MNDIIFLTLESAGYSVGIRNLFSSENPAFLNKEEKDSYLILNKRSDGEINEILVDKSKNGNVSFKTSINDGKMPLSFCEMLNRIRRPYLEETSLSLASSNEGVEIFLDLAELICGVKIKRKFLTGEYELIDSSFKDDIWFFLITLLFLTGSIDKENTESNIFIDDKSLSFEILIKTDTQIVFEDFAGAIKHLAGDKENAFSFVYEDGIYKAVYKRSIRDDSSYIGFKQQQDDIAVVKLKTVFKISLGKK